MNLNLEILDIIINHLSQRQKAICALVCKRWYKACRYRLYRSVELKSRKHLKRFLRGLQNSDRNGRFVRIINMYDGTILKQKDKRWLQALCPFLERLDGCYHFERDTVNNKLRPLARTITHNTYGCFYLPGWSYLTSLPICHQDLAEEWIPQLKDQLLDLSIASEEIQPVCQSHFSKLVSLCIENSCENMDVIVLEHIHQACPSLESLTLTADSISSHDDDDKKYSPSLSLKHLSLKTYYGYDTAVYDYFSQKYINLQSFKLITNMKRSLTDLLDDYGFRHSWLRSKQALFNMITSFTKLTTLDLQLWFCAESDNELLPIKEIIKWLNQQRLGQSTSPRQLINLSLNFMNCKTVLNNLQIKTPVSDHDDDDNNNNNDDHYPSSLRQFSIKVDSFKRLNNELKQIILYGEGSFQHLTHLTLGFDIQMNNDIELIDSIDPFFLLHTCPSLKYIELCDAILLEPYMERKQTLTTKKRQNKRNKNSQPTNEINQQLLDKYNDMTSTTSIIFGHHLQYLVLSNLWIRNDQYLEKFIKSCPKLNTLKLNGVQFLNTSDNDLAEITINVPNHKLDILYLNYVQTEDTTLDYLQICEMTRQGAKREFFTERFKKEDEEQKIIYIKCEYADDVRFL